MAFTAGKQVRATAGSANPFGGAKGIRTPDLLDANESRYQLRHSPWSVAQATSRGAVAETDRNAADLLARRAWQVVVARRWAVVEVFEDGVFVVDLQHDRAGAAQPGRHEVELAVVGVLHAQP